MTLDKNLELKRRRNMLITMLVSFVLCYMLLNVVMTYLLLFIKQAGQANKTFPGTTVAEQQTDMSFKLSYLYYCEGFDYKMLLVTSAGLAIFICYRYDQWWIIKHANKGLKGDARWATEKDLMKYKDLYCIEDEDHLEEAEKSGIILAKYNERLYCDAGTSHSLIIGTTRSGKGQTFVLPKLRAIAMSKAKHSLVINDAKGELCEYMYQTLVDNGYKVVILNLSDTNHSSLWDPLYNIKKEYTRQMDSGEPDLSETSDLVAALTLAFTENPKSDPIWPESAQALFTAIVFYLLEDAYHSDKLINNGTTPNMDRVTLYSVYQFFITFGTINRVKEVNGAKKYVNALEELFEQLPIGNPARSAYATTKFASGEMLSSIEGTLSSNLKIFGSDQGIAKLTSGNQIDFKDLLNPDKPCAIFMIVPDEKPTRHGIASLFITQCCEYLVSEARKYQDNHLPQRVIFELDEFGNMVRIPNMDNKATVCAGRNILFSLYCQDLNQLDSKYGDTAKTIRSNCTNVIYIMSNDKDTNEYMSALLGNETIEFKTYSGNLRDWLDHQNVNIDSRPLMSGEQLSRLDEGMAITKRMRCYPIKTKLDYFYKLGIAPTPLAEVQLDFVDVKLDEVIYDFAPIGKKIDLFLNNGVFEDLSRVPQPASHMSAVAAAAPQSRPMPPIDLNKEKGLPPTSGKITFTQLPTPEDGQQTVSESTSSAAPASPLDKMNNELKKLSEKLDIYTDKAFGGALNRCNYKDANRLLVREYKVKRHISSVEFEMMAKFISNNEE